MNAKANPLVALTVGALLVCPLIFAQLITAQESAKFHVIS